MDAPAAARLPAAEFNARWDRGLHAAVRLEPRLQRQYEAALLATARKVVAAYRAKTRVHHMTAAGWDESKHLRHPAGETEGGQFTAKDAANVMVNAIRERARRRGEAVDEKNIAQAMKNWERHAKQAIVGDQSGIARANAYNQQSDLYQAAQERFGADAALLITTSRGAEEASNLLVTTARAARRGGVSLVRDDAGFAPMPTGEVRPGDGFTTDAGGLPAALRHEYGHTVADGMTATERATVTGLFPRGVPLREQLTTYADMAHGDERIPELFAVVSDPAYDSSKWAPWVDEARRTIAGMLSATAVVTAAGDEPLQPPQPQLTEILDAELAAASAAARTRATRARMAREVGTAITAGFHLEPQLRDVLRALVEAQAGAQAERLIAGTRDAVARILLDALTEGWTVDDTATRLEDELRQVSRSQATMLARTDLVGIRNAAAQASAIVLGDDGPQFKTWLSAGDSRVRPSHVEANGQVQPIDAPYDVGTSRLQFPGDPAGDDADVINCRCVSIFSDGPAPVLKHSAAGGMHDTLVVAGSAARAQDIPGEFPELYAFQVARNDVVETDPGVFQMIRPATLRDGRIAASHGETAG